MKYDLGNLDKWVSATQGRVDAVVKQSFQDVIEIAQTPRAKGGRMPVDTGFLRNSGIASLNRLPSGSSSAGEWEPGSVTLTIYRAEPGDTLYFGWVANYGKYMERRYGFMRLAAQRWGKTVANNAAKLKAAAEKGRTLR